MITFLRSVRDFVTKVVITIYAVLAVLGFLVLVVGLFRPDLLARLFVT